MILKGGKNNHKLLFIDTETTGFPRNDWKACKTNIVEIGWILTDNFGKIIKEYYTLIKPVGFKTTDNWISYKTHKIKQSEAMKYGKPICDVLNLFLDAVDECDVIVGHNVAFDLKIINNMLNKKGIVAEISRDVKCTCKMSKRMSLGNLYKKLFGVEMASSHRVKDDILATMKCYFKLGREN